MNDWKAQAACRGKGNELFYSTEPDEIEEAKLVCVGCPVRATCRDTGRDEPGVWGGQTFNERSGHPERDHWTRYPTKPCTMCSTPFRPATYNARYCADCRAVGTARRQSA